MTRRSAMEPGERDHTILIQQRAASDAVDSVGAPTDDPWTTLVAAMPASREDISARERFAAEQLSASYDTRWEINYRLDMDPWLIDVPKLRRILYQGRVLNIVAANQIGRREGVELLTLGHG